MLELSIQKWIITLSKRVSRKLLEIEFVPTGDQIADGFTKLLSVWLLENFNVNLNSKALIEGGC